MDEKSTPAPNPYVIIGGPKYVRELQILLQDTADLTFVGDADTARAAAAVAATGKAELAVIDANVGGPAQGIQFARDILHYIPGCGVILTAQNFDARLAMHLWVYGRETWSVITNASLKNPDNMNSCIQSAIRNMPWIEPGIQRVMKPMGARPAKLADRERLLLDNDTQSSAAM